MQEHLDGDSFLSLLTLLLPEQKTPVLYVEGEYDRLALHSHISNGFEVRAGRGGREHMLKAARMAAKKGYSVAKFLIDRDYTFDIQENFASIGNILVSSNHDLFMDLVHADRSMLSGMIRVCLNGVTSNHPDSSLNEQVEEVLNSSLRRAGQLAAVRIVNERQSLGLNFSRTKLNGNLKSAQDLDVIVATILQVNRREDLDAAELSREAGHVYLELGSNLFNIVGDHDFLDAIGVALRDRGVKLGTMELQRMLVHGVTCRSVSATTWFTDIQCWCKEAGRSAFDCELARESTYSPYY